ncbi:unnamed protein product [Sphenostylis stenocarpa]|uniref:RRM domain-containing protein n=1 Tax=Sphenostylis stenocarpa TaxID=92480 RepID=A0AA86S3B0_9FABA|nr:unnamed protein product [Sphenostylis stenocarpa]
MAMMQGVQKNNLYVGGLAEEVDESILHAAFIPFGDIKDIKTPLDQTTQKHRSFGFVTFPEREDAAELYCRVLSREGEKEEETEIKDDLVAKTEDEVLPKIELH